MTGSQETMATAWINARPEDLNMDTRTEIQNAVYVGGTSCCCKTTAINLPETGWQPWKNTEAMGQLGDVKNTDPLAAHTWTVTNMLANETGRKLIVDRTPLDNEAYRMVYYLMVHPDRWTHTNILLAEYVRLNNLGPFLDFVTRTTRCVFVIDSNVERLALRMHDRNHGSDSVRWSHWDYHEAQNRVFKFLHETYPSTELYDLAFGNDLDKVLSCLRQCLVLQISKCEANAYAPSQPPRFKELERSSEATVLKHDWAKLNAITRR